MTLRGTIYATNCTPGHTCVSGTNMTDTLFQTVEVWGGGSSSTFIRGEIIASELALGGSGTILMNLDPALRFPVNQIALVK